MATSSVEQRPGRSEVHRALQDERFGDRRTLRREQITAGSRGLGARRCVRCHAEHDQAVAAGGFPQPVQLALAGSGLCRRHTSGGS